MKIVIAPDSFKGSASSSEIADWLSDGIHSVSPEYEVVKVAIGDGGEGSLDAILASPLQSRFSQFSYQVSGPLGQQVSARIGIRDTTAFVELAQASGLSLLPQEQLAPLKATSYGTGELILRALEHGVNEIILAVGGSATTDAGAGALQALGAHIYDQNGAEIEPGGQALGRAARLDISELDSRLANVKFILASDVENPLLGDFGAAKIFSPQKGANQNEVTILEEGLSNFASLCGDDFANKPGAGAAGGFGFMAYQFLHAQQRSGIELILELLDFEKELEGADLVITGEGKYDSQTKQGKAPHGILKSASHLQIPVILVCGQVRATVNALDSLKFHSIYSLHRLEPNLEICRNHPEPLLREIGQTIARNFTI